MHWLFCARSAAVQRYCYTVARFKLHRDAETAIQAFQLLVEMRPWYAYSLLQLGMFDVFLCIYALHLHRETG